MIFNIWIILIVFSVTERSIAQDVQLSIENSSKSEYVGYVWSNSKFVFLTPHLKASAVKGKSVSEKICGFELTSTELKKVPFIVYLVDEQSGLGEIQVKPHIDLDHQKESMLLLTVEAYDCDTLPHYSNRVNVSIHISKLFGPTFNRNGYSFSIKKDSPVGAIVGKVSVRETDGRSIKYSLYNAGNLPIDIDDSGTIRISSSLNTISHSLIYSRVVATEELGTMSKQSIVSVAIEIQPICENVLSGIPDQLDYRVKIGTTGTLETERLIPDQHQPRLIICDLSSPFKQIRLSVSLIQTLESGVHSNNNRVCPADISASKLQRRVCNAPPATMNLFLSQEGIIYLNDETKTIGPEILPELKNEFTFSWWMKRESKQETMIFCFQNKGFKEILSLSIEDCKLIITLTGKQEIVNLPSDKCKWNTWLYYTMSQEWHRTPSLRITIADHKLSPISIIDNIIPNKGVRFFVGQCSSTVNTIQGELGQKNKVEIGVISLSKDKSFSTETVGCMSTCGEALLASDSMKKLPNTVFERRGSSLHFTSTSIPKVTEVLSMIDYVNSYYWTTAGKQNTQKGTTNVAIDLFVDCHSGATITVARTLIKVNIILPQREVANETMEVDIYASSTILANESLSIRLFADFRFMNSFTEEPVKRDIRLESCSIRPLQRNFKANEKIYLSRLMIPILMESRLKIRNDQGSWNIVGDGTAELYESLLRHVTFDMVNERRKLFIICTLKGGELTSQAFIDVILTKKSKITIIKEDNPTDLDHNSLTGQKNIFQREDKHAKDNFDISKSKFIAVVIMSVVGGATWAVITVAIACFIIRRRGNLITRNRIKMNDIKTYQRELSPTFHSRPTSSTNPLSPCTHYQYAEDRISMEDIPDTDQHCLDSLSCDTCNMTDPDNSCNNTNITKDIPRSKTISFPIVHKRF